MQKTDRKKMILLLALMAMISVVALSSGCSPHKNKKHELKITTTTLPDGVLGVAYCETIEAIYGKTPYTWSMAAGDLPNGLFLYTSAGEIWGTPTVEGDYEFTVMVTDAENNTATQALSITTNDSVIPSDNESVTINRAELVNTLEFGRQKGFSNEMEAATYVWMKDTLQSEIDNKQEIIDYLDGLEQDDGLWGTLDGSRPKAAMFILSAYSVLDATPAKNEKIQEFLSENYDTWEKVLPYREKGSKYHLVVLWEASFGALPPWMPGLFDYYESDLDWTTNDEMHTRTHILYCYAIAERPFPNAEEIINTTLEQQNESGIWIDPGFPNALHETGTQLHFIEYMLEPMYPENSAEFQAARDRAKPYIISCYKTLVEDNQTAGYFVDCLTGEVLFEYGIIPAVCAGLITDNGNYLYNKRKILNQVESRRTPDGGYNSDVFDTGFGLLIYKEVGELPPNHEKIISYYDAAQAEDGSWGAEKYHWGPNTAQALMIYDALDAEPAKSLDTFFEKIDTWEEVLEFTFTYHEDNFWGGIWGPVVAWYLYYDEDPPWWDEYDKAVGENRDTWESDTHQSSHVIIAYYQLEKPFPEFTVDAILASQQEDGGWNSYIGETTFALCILDVYYNSVEPLESIKKAAVHAKSYLSNCYYETGDYAWFSSTPSEWWSLNFHTTWSGIFGLHHAKGL